MKVIITCANSPIMNEVISLIGSIPQIKDIILVDSEEIIFSHGVKCTMRVPRGNDKDYNSAIRSIVEQLGVQFIFVCSDEEALSLSSQDWARNLSHLDDYKNISLVLNKYHLHQTLQNAESSLVPEFMKLESIYELTKVVEQYGSVILRPIYGRGSRGLTHIVAKEQKQKYAMGSSIQDFIIPNDADNYFLTEYLSGDKFSADCVFHKGKILSCMIRNNGNSVKYKPPTMIAETSVDEDVYAFAQKVGEILNLDGFHQIECGKDSEGTVKLIEINPRLDATLPITVCYAENFYELIISRQERGLLKPVQKIFKRFFISNTK
jgi:predicted ATP-grasp superfamily ATP-dependent carboligase